MAGTTTNPAARARSAPVFTLCVENDACTRTDPHSTNRLELSWLSAGPVDWGQTGRSRSMPREPCATDLSVGLRVIAGRWQLACTQGRRTREFETQRGRDNAFGAVTLSRAY